MAESGRPGARSRRAPFTTKRVCATNRPPRSQLPLVSSRVRPAFVVASPAREASALRDAVCAQASVESAAMARSARMSVDTTVPRGIIIALSGGPAVCRLAEGEHQAVEILDDDFTDV